MIVRQIANALALLEYFAKIKRPATLSEISDQFSWPRSSTFNLLSTLSEHGFVYEPRARLGYYPSPKWLALASQFADAQPLPPSLYSIISELAEETGETAAVGAPAGTNAIFVAVAESANPVRYTAPVGHRLPIHESATGRALLAQYPRAEREALLRRVKFQAYTKQSLLSIEEVEREIRAAEERGWHQSIGGYSADLFGVALPLALADRKLCIVVAGPGFRVGDRFSEIAQSIRRAIKRHELQLNAVPLDKAPRTGERAA